MFMGMGTLACPGLWVISGGAFTAQQAARDVCDATAAFLEGAQEPWIASAFACVTVPGTVEDVVTAQTLQTNTLIAGALLVTWGGNASLPARAASSLQMTATKCHNRSDLERPVETCGGVWFCRA